MKKLIISVFIVILSGQFCYCATRFYLASTGEAPSISPAPLAWTDISALKRMKCNNRQTFSPFVLYNLPIVAGNKKHVLNVQYISPPLIAQTIRGSVEGQVKGWKADATKTGSSNIAIQGVNKYGTQEAILLAINTAFGTNTYPTEEATNRYNPVKWALTPWTCSDGAYLVIEIGSYTGPGGAGVTSQEVGDSAPQDLPRDETTVGNYNPWVEFSNLIMFKSQVTIIE